LCIAAEIVAAAIVSITDRGERDPVFIKERVLKRANLTELGRRWNELARQLEMLDEDH
jgi:hypothetical protein